eukprot:CAMPEP_0175132026 /NCGR_PEP_ID=MMETSP0087-20121206/6859_1 /TAXON_ID=136419 /ORGANISM="Unknown Unknown, Strain D1" /LENGTH=303 /DNA_ID=CAMNT_0016414361 /DNA_START=24 /DNA_END=932 /DNA_ORIENTATION=+
MHVSPLFALCGYVFASQWIKQADGPWGAREGLMALSFKDELYLTGGRGTNGVGFANDVWKSSNGSTWEKVGTAPWGRRSYHVMLELNNCMYIMGGQTFTTFYNDVWRSCDGSTWTEVTAKAPWAGRAGLAGVTYNGQMIIAGGCYNKNNNPLARSFFSDVWSSPDGETWTLLNSSAWLGRSGPRLVAMNDELFLVAGERGFTPSTQLSDIYSSKDGGKTWELVTDSPGFSARSGHGVFVTKYAQETAMLVLAGWDDLHDLYVSPNGKDFKLISNSTWNCQEHSCGRFDFWSLVHKGNLVTVGG